MNLASNKTSAQSIKKIIFKVLDTLYFHFSNPKNFHSSQYHPVILCGAEGEVAESIIQHNPRPSGEGGLRRRWV